MEPSYEQQAVLLTTTTTKKEEEEKKEEGWREREKVPDPQESIGDTPTINFHQFSSKSDFREPNFEQQNSGMFRGEGFYFPNADHSFSQSVHRASYSYEYYVCC